MGIRFDQYLLSESREFRGSVQMSARATAVRVKNEDPATPDHTNRVIAAELMLGERYGNTNGIVDLLKMEIAMDPRHGTNGTVKGGILDMTKLSDNILDELTMSLWPRVTQAVINGGLPGSIG